MLEFLFGWLIKPELMQTPLDTLILFIELFILFILIGCFCAIRETIRERKDYKNKGE